MANTTKKNQAKPGDGMNEHNEREHQERLAREAEKLKEGSPGDNEHNRKEHEDKLRREGA